MAIFASWLHLPLTLVHILIFQFSLRTTAIRVCEHTFGHTCLKKYVTVHESHGRNLYYYFVVSENKPSEDLVVLWLNGGPGCSSFDGFIYEHGDHQISILEICFYIKFQFVFQWSELVPDFLSNPFSISGESYAGIYVPTLASEIVKA
ncbi:hypothetical protein K1719_027130 [Acacia pycnantha]|nr:hypothetical protein K1719_027130 [Acacia pycnantha]